MLHIVITLFVNNLEIFFEQTKVETNIRKFPMFFILTTSTNIKIHKAKVEASCFHKVFTLKFAF